ncbi:hypothetical protein ACFQU7_16250 [Pseudoroseomonas wenyumeiae]
MFFGYRDDRHPLDEQRVGGFSLGRYATDAEASFIRQQRTWLGNVKRKTRLYANEADISLAARSLRYFVLTLDAKDGPLREAHRQGGRVIFLVAKKFDESGLSLGSFVKGAIAAWD